MHAAHQMYICKQYVFLHVILLTSLLYHTRGRDSRALPVRAGLRPSGGDAIHVSLQYSFVACDATFGATVSDGSSPSLALPCDLPKLPRHGHIWGWLDWLADSTIARSREPCYQREKKKGLGLGKTMMEELEEAQRKSR